ncbi:hypothetical protein A0256_17655 [Mucilaginibacter sp. PAMC 26640]|nr:hypothetical protein A0256_17655 [Mucilaginibacter sp. PAMC 26640]
MVEFFTKEGIWAGQDFPGFAEAESEGFQLGGDSHSAYRLPMNFFINRGEVPLPLATVCTQVWE